MGWICLLRGQLGRLIILITQLGNNGFETKRNITNYWVYVKSDPGPITSHSKLQVGTGNGIPVDVPLGSGKAVSQRPKWSCCRPVVVGNLFTLSDLSKCMLYVVYCILYTV